MASQDSKGKQSVDSDTTHWTHTSPTRTHRKEPYVVVVVVVKIDSFATQTMVVGFQRALDHDGLASHTHVGY